ncbi:MAG: type pilus assembly protein PilX [Polaromonas sp.]|nr:type pilus assembly protein PilX [Polaromonas sp.]
MAIALRISCAQHSGQKGLSLIIVLIMLSAIFMLAAFGARLTLLGEKSARNDRDRQIAFQAAEAALGDAEMDIMGPNAAANSRADEMDSRTLQLFVEGCGITADSRGLCNTNTSTTPLYKSVDFEETGTSRRYVTLGEYTGRNSGFSTGSSALPAQLPRYIVETIAYNPIQGGCTGHKAFLVSAMGYGLNQQTQVMLQSVIFKPSPNLKC